MSDNNNRPDPVDIVDRISNAYAIEHAPPSRPTRRTVRRPAADIASRIWSGEPVVSEDAPDREGN